MRIDQENHYDYAHGWFENTPADVTIRINIFYDEIPIKTNDH